MRGGGHPTREQHVLTVSKRLLSHIKLLGLRQRINIQLEENQKVINPQRLDLNNKTKDYRHRRNTSTEIKELRKHINKISSRVWNDWGFSHMFYMQYANNIFIIFIASKDEVFIS